MDRNRIILVEDDPDLRDEMVEGLSIFGVDAVPAADGVEALGVLSVETDISVVLTDLRMPNMDGLALAAEVAALYPARRVKVILVSGYLSEVDEELASRLCLFGRLNKPSPLATIVAAVRSALAAAN